MRLPQSNLQFLYLRIVHFLTIGLAIPLLGMAAVNASAATSQLAFVPAGLRFGEVVVGQTQTLLATVTNSGQTSVTVSSVSTGNPEFTTSNLSLPLVLAAGQSVNLNVSFTPTATGLTQGTIRLSSNTWNAALQFNVWGSGVNSEPVTASPSIASFGQVAVGTNSTVPVVLTNARRWRVTLQGVQTTGSGISISGPTFPLTLNPGQSVTLSVTFAPKSTGATGGSAFIFGPSLVIPYTGTGTTTAAGQLSVAPTPLNFGNVVVGSTGTQPVTMSASGASVTVSSASSSSSQFVLNGASFPMTLAAGQSVSLNVAFKPQSNGTASGSLTFVSNASNSQSLTVPSTGIGTAAPAGQLSVAPTPLNFGNVVVGSTGTQPVTMSASGASVTVSSASSSSSQFVLNGASFPMTLAAGQSVSLNVAFKPQSNGTASGSLTFVSNASNSQSLTVPSTGIGTAAPAGQLSVAPTPLNFGNVVVGSTGTQPVTMSASGASVTVSSASSSSSQFVLNGASFPMTLAAGQSVSLNVAFKPQSNGTASGSLTFVSNASNSQSLTVPSTGIGTAAPAGQLSVAPTPLNFGNVVVGSTGTQPVTMSASGASVTVSSASSSSSQFVLNGASFPMTLAAGQSVSLNVAFKPQSNGTASGSLTFVSNASNSQSLTVPSTGIGTAAPAGQLSVAPTPLNFGNVVVGSTGTQPVTMSASGASVTVSSASSSSSQFVLNGASFPMTLAA